MKQFQMPNHKIHVRRTERGYRVECQGHEVDVTDATTRGNGPGGFAAIRGNDPVEFLFDGFTLGSLHELEYLDLFELADLDGSTAAEWWNVAKEHLHTVAEGDVEDLLLSYKSDVEYGISPAIPDELQLSFQDGTAVGNAVKERMVTFNDIEDVRRFRRRIERAACAFDAMLNG